MKTIGLVYGNLSLGGIQRGASFQIPMFAAWGYRVVVLTNAPASDQDYPVEGMSARVPIGVAPGDTERRARAVERIIREYGIDILVHHHAYSCEEPRADILGASYAHVPVIVFWHSVFSHFLLRKTRQLEAKPVFEACRGAVAMITLTKTDEAFFRMSGCPALAIPYSDPDLMKGFLRTDHPRRIVWMGRFDEMKRPMDAVRIFAKVFARFPDAELYMLGAAADPRVDEDLRSFVASVAGLSDAVHFEGFQKDVRPYLAKCGVGLVTSRFEGYCHSIVEMKMASLPVVAYEMPYLDTLKPESGAIQVPQGDVDAAADAVCGLFVDAEACRRQGALARKSYEEIVDVDQKGSYERLFESVLSGQTDALLKIDPQYARLVVRTAVDHVDAALRLMDETVREDCATARGGLRDELKSLPRRVVKRVLAKLFSR